MQIVAEGWKMLFQVPHFAGYDDKRRPWWPIKDDEAQTLAEPVTRMLERLPTAKAIKLALWLDPITLLLGVAALIGPRLEMTRAYGHQLRIQDETEARRAAIARGLTDTPVQSTGRPDAPPANDNGPQPNKEDAPAGGHRIVQDVFDLGAR